MLESWKNFLSQYKAQWKNDYCLSFGDYLTELDHLISTDRITDLTHLGCLKINGDHAFQFLQGQLSCDMREITSQQGQLAVHCNPQGQVIAALLAYQQENDYFLIAPLESLQAAYQSLKRYGLFSKVTFTDLSVEIVRVGFWGPSAKDQLQSYFNELSSNKYSVLHSQGYSIIRLPSAQARYLIIGNQSLMEDLWKSLSKQAKPVSTTAWMVEDVRAGIAHIPLCYQETFTPNVLNFHLINGISFTKGCYTGQEVIARIHYLGKLKQRVFYIRVEGELANIEGMMLLYSDDTPVGNVLQLYQTGANLYEGLAVIYIKAFEGPPLVLEEYINARVKILTLPYET